MKVSLLLTIVAIVLVAGCSSDGPSGPLAPDSAELDGQADTSPGPGDAASPDAVLEPPTDGAADVASEVTPELDVLEVDVAPDLDVPGGDVPGQGQPSEFPPIEASVTTWFGDWDLTPGDENTKCVIRKLDNPEAIWVTAIHTVLAPGSHHLIVYKAADQAEQPEPFGCTPFLETLTGQAYPLIITQVAEESLVMPAGVAIKLEPYQTIRMEAHFLNYYPEVITAHGEITFDIIAPEDVWKEANLLFYGDVDFEIPPNQTFQTDWAFLPVAEGVEIFAVTGHTHQRGTNVEIYHADNAEDDSTPIYPLENPFVWDEAPVTQFDPPLAFDGDNGLRFRCSWDNPTDQTLEFGESADKEMCFLWAYYYPSSGYQVCVDLGEFGTPFGLEHICCPGSFVCNLIPGLL